jgi:hypothetical protein
MAISINRDMDQGSDFSFSYIVRGSDGSPMDISTGYTAYSQMRRFYSSTTGFDLTASITGSTGNIIVSMSATNTANIKAGVWFYDVELHSNGSENVQRVVQGMITVYPEITKIS